MSASPPRATHRVGIDIGGTFTDGLIVEMATGESFPVKVDTTPEDPSAGFLEALARSLRAAGCAGSALSAVLHATTAATNALIEGRLAPSGLITTEGFRDLFEIGRQIRPKLYDVFAQKPPPLVPRRWALGVPERMDARGEVERPLDEGKLREAVRFLRREGVRSLVVCFLHSYANPAHELRARELIREELPEAHITLSHQVCSEYREFFRASTAAVNAAILPLVARYLDGVEGGLRARGVEAPLFIMQSGGGTMGAEAARERPVFLVESGPAAGAIAAASLARRLGLRKALSLDMGGTTAKVGLIREGRPRLTTEYEVGVAATSRTSSDKGGGYPIRTPVIDLVEIGAGGGSLAWADAGGALRVGPQSAGASPGPACYGRGGARPTVTDANLALGRLNADYFLGGEIPLEAEASLRALEEVGLPLGLSAAETAAGVLTIANQHMIQAIRLVSVQRGYDPREFALVAFGGAGPLHAAALAAELGIPAVVVPPSPGVHSARGLLLADVTHEFVRTRLVPLSELDPREAEGLFAAMAHTAEEALARERGSYRSTLFRRQVELRYAGQSYEVALDWPGGGGGRARGALARDFHEAHRRLYGYAAEGDAIEVVNLRLTGVGETAKPSAPELPLGGGGAEEALKGERQVHFPEAGAGGWVRCPTYERYRLGRGTEVEGPAIVEERDATTLVPHGARAIVDRWGNLIILTRGTDYARWVSR